MSNPTSGAAAQDQYEPLAVDPAYEEITARVDPDASLGWVRRLLPLVVAQRKALILVLATMVIGIATQVTVPAVARQAIDLATADDRSGLTNAVVFMAILGVGRMFAAGTYRYLLFRTAYRLDTTLRMQIYRHLTTLSFSYYDRTQSGDIISRANSDIRSIQMMLAFTPLFLTSVIVFGIALFVMLSIHVLLTLVALATLPGVWLLGQAMRNQVFPLTWVTQSRTANIAMIVDENVNGTRVVKSFAAEQRQVETMAKAATELRWSSTETIRQRARFNPLIEALPRLSTALVLLYGGWLAIQGDVTIGTLFAFNAYVLMLQVPFRMVGFILLQGQRARASAERIFQILDEEPEVEPGALDLGQVEGAVEFDAVSFAYKTDDPNRAGRKPKGEDNEQDAAEGPREIVTSLSLQIAPGETVALVGRTGCGKSTVARLLGRFYDVDEGTIRIDGTDVRDASLTSLRHNIGMVLDDPFLFSTSLHDNIAYGRPDASRADVIAAAKAAQAHDFIEATEHGYDTVVGERGYTLSGGQRQRISIARALLYDPAILILDDATSAIDVHVESLIHDALTETIRNRTTIVIAHRLSTISLADRVLLMDGGTIVAEGTHEHLMTSEQLYREILASGDDGDDSESALPAGATV